MPHYVPQFLLYLNKSLAPFSILPCLDPRSQRRRRKEPRVKKALKTLYSLALHPKPTISLLNGKEN
jgi:hypothetical protein